MRRLFAVFLGLLESLRAVADRLDLVPAHEFEAVAAVLEFGDSVEADDFAALAHRRRVVQLLVRAIDQFEPVGVANLVRGNADDLPERRARSISPLYPMMTCTEFTQRSPPLASLRLVLNGTR